MNHTHSLAEWAAVLSAATGGYASCSFFYFLLVEASRSDFSPRRLLDTRAADRLCVEVVRARQDLRELALTAAALLMLLTARPEATR